MRKPPRNPRRAYDENGDEISPVTVGRAIADGYKTVMTYCEAHECGHGAEVPLEGWPLDLPVPDMALRLRCSQCGSKAIRMMINVRELYARTSGTGPKPPIHESPLSGPELGSVNSREA